MMAEPMRTLAAPAEHAEEIKNSRFIARAAPVDSVQAALDFIERVGEPAATHNCWAYRVGDAYRFSDDGEPGGTAGKPILGAIDRAGLDAVAVVVTRYFGGVKLGAGGLARAYGGTTARCLDRAPRHALRPTARCRLTVPFAALGPVRDLLERHEAEVLAEDYDAEGARFSLELPEENRSPLAAELANATAGEAILEQE